MVSSTLKAIVVVVVSMVIPLVEGSSPASAPPSKVLVLEGTVSSLDRISHERTPWLVTVTVKRAAKPENMASYRLVGAAGDGEASQADARHDPTMAMKAAALSDPCAVIRAALGADRKSCGTFRDRHGILRVHATLIVDNDEVELLKPGKICPGGYLGVRFQADDSPKKFASFLDVDFGISSEDERLSFSGNNVRWSRCPNCGTLGKGCFDVDGWLVLRQGGWLRPGDLGGCAAEEKAASRSAM